MALVLILCSSFANAQVDWKINGNTVTTDSKLGTNTGYDLIIETSNLERMRFTNAGNIGIGVLLPLSKLHLGGDFRIDGNIHLGLLEDNNAEDYRYTYLDHSGILRSGSSSLLLDEVYKDDCKMLPNGNFPSPIWKTIEGENFGVLFTGISCPARVGIGTDAPDATLHVAGNTFISNALHIGSSATFGTNNRFRIGSGGLTPQILFNVENNGHVVMNTTTDDGATMLSLNNATTSLELLRIKDNGKTDIRFSGPISGVESEMFAIKDAIGNDMFSIANGGMVYCQGLFVKHAPYFPDYVFAPDYKLPNLYDLERYIQEERHLPSIPTAETIANEGADMYQLMRLLVEKVEELTLYTIEQQKEIDALKLILKN